MWARVTIHNCSKNSQSLDGLVDPHAVLREGPEVWHRSKGEGKVGGATWRFPFPRWIFLAILKRSGMYLRCSSCSLCLSSVSPTNTSTTSSRSSGGEGDESLSLSHTSAITILTDLHLIHQRLFDPLTQKTLPLGRLASVQKSCEMLAFPITWLGVKVQGSSGSGIQS